MIPPLLWEQPNTAAAEAAAGSGQPALTPAAAHRLQDFGAIRSRLLQVPQNLANVPSQDEAPLQPTVELPAANAAMPIADFEALAKVAVYPAELLQLLPRDTESSVEARLPIDLLAGEVLTASADLESAVEDLFEWKDQLLAKSAVPSAIKMGLTVLCARIYRHKASVHEPLFSLLREARTHARPWSLRHDAIALLERKFAHHQQVLAAAVRKMQQLDHAFRQERVQRIANRWGQLVSRMIAVQRQAANQTEGDATGGARAGGRLAIPGSGVTSGLARFQRSFQMKQSIMTQTDPVAWIEEMHNDGASGLAFAANNDAATTVKQVAEALDPSARRAALQRQDHLAFTAALRNHFPSILRLLADLHHRPYPPTTGPVMLYHALASRRFAPLLQRDPLRPPSIRRRALSAVHVASHLPLCDHVPTPWPAQKRVRANSANALYDVLAACPRNVEAIHTDRGKLLVDLKRHLPGAMQRGAELDPLDADAQTLAALETRDRLSLQGFVQGAVRQGADALEAAHVQQPNSTAENEPDDESDSEDGATNQLDEMNLVVKSTLDATNHVIPGILDPQLLAALERFPDRQGQQRTYSMLDMMKLAVLHAQQMWFMHAEYQRQITDIQAQLDEALKREASNTQRLERQLETERTRVRMLADESKRLQERSSKQQQQFQDQIEKQREMQREAARQIASLAKSLHDGRGRANDSAAPKSADDVLRRLENYGTRRGSPDPAAGARPRFVIPHSGFSARRPPPQLPKVLPPLSFNSERLELGFLDRMTLFAEERLQHMRDQREQAAANSLRRLEPGVRKALVPTAVAPILHTGPNAPIVISAEFMPQTRTIGPSGSPSRALHMLLDRTGNVIETPWVSELARAHQKAANGPTTGSTSITRTTTTTTTTTTTVTSTTIVDGGIPEGSSSGEKPVVNICNLFDVARRLVPPEGVYGVALPNP